MSGEKGLLLHCLCACWAVSIAYGQVPPVDVPPATHGLPADVRNRRIGLGAENAAPATERNDAPDSARQPEASNQPAPKPAAHEELRQISQTPGTTSSAKESTQPSLQLEQYKPRDVDLSEKSSWIDYQGQRLPMAPLGPQKDRKANAKSVPSVLEELEQLRAASGGAEPKVLNLTREQCVQLLLQHSQEIEVERLEWDIRHHGLKKEQWVFEPDFVAGTSRESSERQNTVEQIVSLQQMELIEHNNRYNSGIEGRMPTGGRYNLGVTVSRLSNNLNRQIMGITIREPFDPEYTSFAGVSLTQPLLKNGGLKTNLGPMRIARKEADVAYENLRKRMMSLVGRTESTYWDLVSAQRRYDLSSASVEIARKIVEDYEERMKTGKASGLELADARAGLAERRSKRSAALQTLVETRNSLRSLFSDSVVKTDVTVVAADQPGAEPVQANLVESMERAMQGNPDYVGARHTLEKENITVAVARNQRLPQIDLQASYGLNGLGDTPEEAWQDTENSAYKAWSVGVQLRVPLGGGQSAKHECRAAKLRKKQALLNMKNMEVVLANSLDAIIQNIGSSRDLIESSKARATFGQELLDAEYSRFEEGKSDSRRVFDVEDGLSQARIEEMDALVAYQKTLILLELAEGSYLKNRGIEIRAK